MIVKFNDIKEDKFLEIEKQGDTVQFFIAETGEEQVGQFIDLPLKEIQNLIKYLQSLQMYQ